MDEFKDLETYDDEEEIKPEQKSNTKKFFEGIKKVFVKPKTKEDEELERIKEEAHKEALEEIKPQLKEEFKRQELEKLSKPKKSVMQKLGEEFTGGSKVLTGMASDERLKRMIGGRTNTTDSTYEKLTGRKQKSDPLGNIGTTEQLQRMMNGANTTPNPQPPRMGLHKDKIREIVHEQKTESGPSNEKILEMMSLKKKK